MRRLSSIFAGVAALVPVCALGQGRDSRPLLEQLNRETISLINEVQHGIVQVQLPTPRWVVDAADRNSPLDDPNVKLNDEMRRRLEEQRAALRKGELRGGFGVTLTTAPATAPAIATPGWKSAVSPDGREIVFEGGGGTAIRIDAGGARGPNGQITGGKPTIGFVPAADFVPNNVGLLLDAEGHFLVPLYVERETVPKEGVRVAIAAEETRARFVGSDRQTGITILKLEKPLGRAVRMSVAAPTLGSLVLLLSPNSDRAKLIVWMNNVQEAGVVANVDGTIAGFARYGTFFSARAARPVIDQLTRSGSVRRVTLGITVTAVAREDPARRTNAILSDRPALRVQTVEKGSVADRARLASGDLIFAIGSEPVGDLPTFAAFLSAQQDRTALQVLRGRQTQIVTLDLAPATAPATKP